ncbi:MAG: hypothetical protein ABIS17_14520 [Casimicrobiaceae bacterium]
MSKLAMAAAVPQNGETVHGEELAAANVEKLRKASDEAARPFSMFLGSELPIRDTSL